MTDAANDLSSAGGPLGSSGASIAQRTVRAGDSLTRMVRREWASQGQSPETLSAGQAHRWALAVAQVNGLGDGNRIRPGQVLQVPQLALQALQAVPAQTSPQAAQPATQPLRSPTAPAATVMASALAVPASTPAAPAGVLRQVLDRAVQKGFVPAAHQPAVEARIHALAEKHGFQVDDFARTVLMESDGLNPRASNGQCFGIIQFCRGPDRGASSAGYGQNPAAILQLSVLEQLHLVDRYFEDTRLRDFRSPQGRVPLDDLYLTILTPAARGVRNPQGALPISGPQAPVLHVGQDRRAPITRTSLLEGLHRHAEQQLTSAQQALRAGTQAWLSVHRR